jgi:hypothetical protein
MGSKNRLMASVLFVTIEPEINNGAGRLGTLCTGP